jgi:hypothetical protein
MVSVSGYNAVVGIRGAALDDSPQLSCCLVATIAAAIAVVLHSCKGSAREGSS